MFQGKYTSRNSTVPIIKGKIDLLKMQLSHIKQHLSYTKYIFEDLNDDMDMEYNMLDDSGSGSDEIDEF